MNLRHLIPLLCLPLTLLAEPSVGEKLFALKVKPLFAEKCNACHADESDKLKGDFDMRSREAILTGGEYFAEEVLTPGKAEQSYLYITTTRSEEDYEMPPKEADKLTQEQQSWIRDWINEGAPWLTDSEVAEIQEKYADGVQVTTSRALSDDWQNRRYDEKKLWAYHPLKVSEVPDGVHPIDYFIDRKLQRAEISPAPEAGPREMARRIRFVITGLPPTRSEVENFAIAYQRNPEEAVSNFANRLMALPQYGEHFARHWLDVARYADSAGFANDYSRPNAWRYRDYVVRSFNQDKPYDDFVREQIAGDEIDPDDPEHLIATGFLRMGPWEQTSMSVFAETRQLWLDDVTDSVGQTFLAHAMQCAKCHDHKFDPLPTRDYYSMMAVFSTTQFAERDAKFLEEENLANFDHSSDWIRAKNDAYHRQKKQLTEKVGKNKKEETGAAKVGENGLDPGDEASLARISKNITRHRIEQDRIAPLALSVYTGKTITRKNVQGRIDLPPKPWAKGTLSDDTILGGGSVYSPTEPVTPGVLSAAVSLGEMAAPTIEAGMSKRRKAFAEWVVDPKNPLTARVMVNRVWSWHFGRGLAGNPNNFGGTGALPTHPALLDYLADWFMKNDWSVKALNRLIVSSDLYRRSSLHPDRSTVTERDPKGQLYAVFKPRRLSAEELRDAMLAASGELNPQVGGIPARPDINVEVATQPVQIMGGTASVYEPDVTPKQRNRRTLYAERLRGLRDPFLESFNQPGSDNSCELRETSTVAPQALTLFNAEEVHDRALAFADRITKADLNEVESIRRAFEIAFSRPPTNDEFDACLAHWETATAEEATNTPEKRIFADQIERTVMAEKTGEPYTFTEFLPNYTNYVPDLQPSEVDAATRGLAQICLVLFNLNEFTYLD